MISQCIIFYFIYKSPHTTITNHNYITTYKTTHIIFTFLLNTHMYVYYVYIYILYCLCMCLAVSICTCMYVCLYICVHCYIYMCFTVCIYISCMGMYTTLCVYANVWNCSLLDIECMYVFTFSPAQNHIIPWRHCIVVCQHYIGFWR